MRCLPTTFLFASSMAAVLALAACQRQPEAAPSGAADAPTQAAIAATQPANDAHPTDVISEVDNSPGPTEVDVRLLAGVFSGIVPCADCPGIDTTLELNADGSYALHELYQDRDDKARDSTGVWTAEQGGQRIRLDPGSQDDNDRLFRIVSNDELEMLDSDGDPPDSDLDYSLRRSGVAK